MEPPSDEQRPVVCVTFPRSGHHYLVNLLSDALESKLVYCEWYTTGMIEGANLIKDHDLEQERVPNPSEPYIIQIRHPLDCIISLFEQRIRMELVGDTPSEWEQHAGSEIANWMGFFSKWVSGVAESKDFQSLLVRYEELVANPSAHLAAAIRHLGFTPPTTLHDGAHGTPLKNDPATSIPMDGYFVRKKQLRSAQSFRYFNRPFFEQLLEPVSKLPRASEWQYDRIPTT